MNFKYIHIVYSTLHTLCRLYGRDGNYPAKILSKSIISKFCRQKINGCIPPFDRNLKPNT